MYTMDSGLLLLDAVDNYINLIMIFIGLFRALLEYGPPGWMSKLKALARMSLHASFSRHLDPSFWHPVCGLASRTLGMVLPE
jgi:hypothetical protein